MGSKQSIEHGKTVVSLTKTPDTKRGNTNIKPMADPLGHNESESLRAAAQMAVRKSFSDPSQEGLLRLLTLARPAHGIVESALAETIVSDLGGVMYYTADHAPAAVLVSVGVSDTLFTCHLDTVHHADAIQDVVLDANLGVAYRPQGSQTPLGADDGAGIWLLLQMISAGVPGTYGFFFCEERGGIGASAMAAHHSSVLAPYKRAIAFDRRGKTNVITHQGMGRCCSDKFGAALAEALNIDSGFSYAPDDGGIYTDTAEFVHIIPECTNVSCGYQNEHSVQETLDVDHLVALRNVCVSLNWDTLPTERDPSVVDDDYGWGGFGRGFGEYKPMHHVTGLSPCDEWDIQQMKTRDVRDYVYENPRDAADLLMYLAERLVELQTEEADDEESLNAQLAAYPGAYFDREEDFI